MCAGKINLAEVLGLQGAGGDARARKRENSQEETQLKTQSKLKGFLMLWC